MMINPMISPNIPEEIPSNAQLKRSRVDHLALCLLKKASCNLKNMWCCLFQRYI